MPELPEVENIKLGLFNEVIDRSIVDVDYSETVINAHKAKRMAIIKQNLEYFSTNIKNKKIIGLERRGKYLYFKLDKGYLITHFGMTGAYFIVNKVEDISNANYYKHRHVIFELDNKKKLVYSDIRRFGEVRYVEDLDSFPPFVKLAPEPFEKKAKTYFLEKLKEKKYEDKEIKPLLLDGSIFTGCGNIYACEVLYKEKINPKTVVKNLSEKKRSSLFNSLVKILEFSIKQGGSTISDYVHSDGGEGQMQNYLQIYGKKLCPKGHKVENVVLKGRSSHYCPVCQKEK